MANGGSIKYSVGFNVDKTGLNQMKASLQELLNLTHQDLIKINSKATVEDLNKIKASAKSVESALEKAFNPNLGTLNVSKFNQELKKLNVQQIYKDFNLAGQAGRNAFRNVTTDVLTTNMQLKQTHTLLDKMATTMSNTIKWGAASAVMNTVTRGAQQAYGYVKSLDSSLNDIVVVTGKSSDEMAKFAVQANKAAKALAASTTSYTDASLIYYQQGLTDAEVAARAEVTLKAANVTGQSADAVSEQLTAVWNGYKVSAEEAELYIDKLAAVAATTASNLEELSTGMSKVAAAANLMGVDADQLNAQLATIVSVTRQAPESVGTALKTIYARMGDIEAGLDSETTLGNYTEAMAEMGFNVLDMNGNLRDMGEVIEEIGNKWSTMSREQQLSLSQTIAGTRQYNNLLSLFDNWDMYTKALDTSANAAGTLQEQQDRYMERTAAHLQQLKTETEDLYDSLFETESFNDLIDGITKLVSMLSNFADAIGGGGNALLALGAIGTQVFSKQIANGLAISIRNMQKAKENAIQLQAELELTQQFGSINNLDGRTKQLVDMKKQFLQLGKNITEEERELSNELIKQTNELFKQEDQLEKRKETIASTYERMTGVTGLDVSNLSEEGKAEVKNDLEMQKEMLKNSQKGTRDLVEYLNVSSKIEHYTRKRKECIDKISQLKKQGLKNNSTEIQQQKEQIRLLTEQIKKLEKKEKATTTPEDLINDMKSLRDEGFFNDKQTKTLNEAFENFEKRTQNLQKGSQAYQGEVRSLAHIFSSVLGVSIDEVDAAIKMLAEDFEKTKQNIQEDVDSLRGRFNSLVQTIELKNMVQGIAQMASAMGQFASSIKTISQLKTIISDDTLSSGEKFLQIVQNIGFALPMFINSLSMMNKSWGDVTEAMIKGANSLATGDKATKLLGKTAAKVSGGVTTLSGAVTTLGAALLNMLLIAGPYLLALGAIGAVIWAGVKGYNADADAAREAAEAQDRAAESVKKVTSAYQELNEAVSGYKDAADKFKKLDEGAEGYAESLEEANEKAMELIRSNSELAKTAKRDSVTGLITFEGKEEELLNDIKTKKNQIAAAYDIASVQANRAQENSNYTNFLRENKIGYYTVSEKDDEEIFHSLNKNQLQDVVNLINSNGITKDELSQLDSLENNDELIDSILEAQDALGILAQNTADLDATNKLLLENSLRDSLLNDKEYAEMSDAEKNAVASIYAEGLTDEEYTKAEAEAKADWYKDRAAIWGGGNEDDVHTAYAEAMGYTLSKDKLGDKASYIDKEGNAITVSDDDARAYLVQLEIAEKIKDYNSESLELIKNGVKELAEGDASQALLDIVSDRQLNSQALTAETVKALEAGLADGTLEKTLGDITDDQWKALGYDNASEYLEVVKSELENFDWDSAYKNSLGKLEGKISQSGDALTQLRKGEALSDEDLQALEQSFPDLAKIWDKGSQEYIEALEEIREAHENAFSETLKESAEYAWGTANEALSEYQDSLKTFNENATEEAEDAAVKAIEALDAELEDFFQQQYELEISVTDDLLTDVDNIIAATEHLQTAVGTIGDGFKIAAKDSQELFNVFPELAHQAEVLADGTIQLDQAVVNEVLKNNGLEIDSDKDVVKESIKNRIAELEAKKAAAQAQLETVRNTAAQDLDIQKILGEGYAEWEKYKVDVDGAASKDEVTNSANATTAIIDNWAAREQAAIDYATTAKAAIEAENGGPVPQARIISSSNYSITTSVDTTNTTDAVEKTVEDSQEILKQDLENFLQNNIDSYEKQVAELTAALGNLNYETTKGIKDAIEERDKNKAKENKKDEMDLVKDQIDIYHDLDLELKNLSNSLSKLGKQEKKLFGQDLINNLNEQLGVLKAQTEVYQDKIDLAKEEASLYRSNLSSQGINFDSQGNVTNYVAAMKGKQDYLNSLISKYNSMSESEQKNFKSTVEQAKKDYEQFQKDMEYYEKLVSDTIPGLEEQIQDALDKQIEIQIQKFTMEVEIRLEMAEAEREWNEFKKKIIDDIDDDDILGNALIKVLDFSSYYKDNGKGIVQSLTKQVEETLDQLNQIDATGTSSVYGDNKAQAMEDLQKYYTELMSQLEDVHDLVDEIGEAYLDMIDEANEKFDEQIEKYETVSDLIEHNMKVIELLNGDDAYSQLSKYYKLQERNNLKQLDFHRQEVAFWRERMESEEEGSEAWEAYRQNWQDAVSDLNATVEKSVEDLIAKYQNTVSGIFADLNDKITNGKGLNFVGEEWDLINKNADQYLDKINAMFEIQQLEGKYRDALDNTDTIAGQNKLNELMTEELSMLREKDKLTQYDIDRANLRYELALKEMALEDAKQSKSQMRLRRDAQGNYSYQFVADQDAISQAEQEVAAAQNDLYNLDKENLDEIYEVYVEFQEKLNELYMDSTLSDAEREEQKLLLVEQYGELINGLVEQNEDIRLNLQESALQAYADFQGTLLMDEIIPQWDSGVQEMADKFAGDGGFIPVCEEALLELDEATQDYEDSLEDLEDTAGVSFDEIEDGIDKNIDMTYDFIDANDELIDRYEEQVDALQEVQREVAELANKYAAAEKAAIAATEAAYKYWQQAKAMAADGLDTGVSSSRVNTSGYTGGGSYNLNGSSDLNSNGTKDTSKEGSNDTSKPTYYAQTGKSTTGERSYTVYDQNKKSIQKYVSISGAELQKIPGTLTILPGTQLYNTGGYTGQWANGDKDGRLAFLHQKELVLNSKDTENVLSAVNIVRSMSDILQSVKSSVSDRISGLMSRFSGGNAIANDHMTIEQNVHIDAKFEGQTESHQIQNALINLVNYASQHAYDTKR